MTKPSALAQCEPRGSLGAVLKKLDEALSSPNCPLEALPG